MNIRNEGGETNVNDKNISGKGSTSSRLQEAAGKIEDTISSDGTSPNPQKAPLNYIENMGEWESAKKTYEKAITQKSLELASVLGSYENKQEELDRFRKAKSRLEIELIKVMGSIANKLMEHSDFIINIFDKLDKSSNEDDGEDENDGEEVYECTNCGNIINVIDKYCPHCGAKFIDADDEQENEKGEDINGTKEENQQVESGQNQLQVLLSPTGFSFMMNGVPFDIGGNTETGELKSFEFIREQIESFLEIVDKEKRPNNKLLLDDYETKGVEDIYSFIKDNCVKYLDLSYQIDIIKSKIAKLDTEETTIGVNYLNLKKEIEKMNEDMQELSETYFLNSYLSTKNVSLDDFITSELVEKQITHIIQAYKEGQPIPKTILLYGKPNLGKTYAANVLATELGRKMYHIRSFDIFTGGFSDPNAMLDAIFNSVIKKKEPCIVFLDEIENFTQGYDGSPYSNLIENTIRHHISKIKESKLDIIIIGAISNRTKVNPSLLKQDIFAKQIYFDSLSEDRCVNFINMIAKEDNVIIGSDINKEKFVKDLKDNEQNQEFLKKLIDGAIDFHKLENGDVENITLTNEDFEKALKHMREYSRIFQGVGF